MPISTRKPKRTVNQSVATPYRRTFALESTIQKPRRSRGTDLYSITLQETTSPNLICLMAKASSSQAWLWHRRLSHLNFDTINLLSKNDIVNGLLKLKFIKDHLCSSCVLGKAKRKSFKTKTTPSSKGRLHLLHMDLCGPMRVESINGKKYVFVIVDAYSRYTWTYFLRSEDKTPKVLIDFLRMIQKGLHTQNGVVEKRYHTLVEAARTMLSAVKIPLFFLAEAIATACFTQNCSLVIRRHEKNHTTYQWKEKPSVKNLSLFLAPNAYIFRDDENHDRMKEKDHDTSGLAPQCQTMTLEHNSLSPDPQMFDEYFNGATPVVSKSSTVTTDDASDKRQ
ncbi:retrovirus-related pol polyprotein from transposon TNT 1-94 [Tanacetum coccineum]